ncbi:phage terminase small subunit-related protein [Cecembia rubra]|uniref:Terminase small subunit n=1 Tax=Cecembia rubra TaxID=1485585 RepID=A0A2P8EAS6_9BACT|nr:phage terminase small subunit-related protein [Cecembia rubra]PSL06547.1 terminase small subunit [Cecembia rubra]
MAGKKDKIRYQAKDYFVENFGATKKEVAELFGVTEKTIGDWSFKDNWENERLNYHASPVKIKQLLQQELLSVAQGNQPKLPADGISKLMSALDKVEKKADPTVVSRILKDLDNFISEEDPEFALKCIHWHKQFLIHRINLEG